MCLITVVLQHRQDKNFNFIPLREQKRENEKRGKGKYKPTQNIELFTANLARRHHIYVHCISIYTTCSCIQYLYTKAVNHYS